MGLMWAPSMNQQESPWLPAGAWGEKSRKAGGPCTSSDPLSGEAGQPATQRGQGPPRDPPQRRRWDHTAGTEDISKASEGPQEGTVPDAALLRAVSSGASGIHSFIRPFIPQRCTEHQPPVRPYGRFQGCSKTDRNPFLQEWEGATQVLVGRGEGSGDHSR